MDIMYEDIIDLGDYYLVINSFRSAILADSTFIYSA